MHVFSIVGVVLCKSGNLGKQSCEKMAKHLVGGTIIAIFTRVPSMFTYYVSQVYAVWACHETLLHFDIELRC